jgi:hypothetical protein
MRKDTKVFEPVMDCSRKRVEINDIRWIETGPISVESVRRSPKQVALKPVRRDTVCTASECMN